MNDSERDFYHRHHRRQDYETAVRLRKFWNKEAVLREVFGGKTVWQMILDLEHINDPSDPNLRSAPQLWHAIQTANAAMKENRGRDWITATLIHDLMKVLMNYCGLNEVLSVGDIYVVGCRFPKSIVCYEFLRENADWDHPIYSTEYGIYQPNCGLENVELCFSHDTLLYDILQKYAPQVPHWVKWVIRHHSLHGLVPVIDDYQHLMNDTDRKYLKKYLRDFARYDFNYKELKEPSWEHMGYYQQVINGTFPEPLIR